MLRKIFSLLIISPFRTRKVATSSQILNTDQDTKSGTTSDLIVKSKKDFRPKRKRRKPSNSLYGFDDVKGFPANKSQYFGEVELSQNLIRALGEMKYQSPTKIQELVIKPFLDHLDIVGQAQTGTGKTASFGIPILDMVDKKSKEVQALVLVPTRELARQVCDEFRKIGKYTQISVLPLYGGTSIVPQLRSLAKGAQVVVGTPGRIIDHMSRGSLRLSKTRIIVLDEADQMLDIGFLPDIRKILRKLPTDRQTCLFTATLPTSIKRLIYTYLHNPEWLIVGRGSMPVEEVEQHYYEVAERDKTEAMVEVLGNHHGQQMLLFCRTQIAVDQVVRTLRRLGHKVVGIHGAMPQKERDSVMARFRSGEVKVLASTNLTARGIDVPTVENVVNFDMPESIEDYLHRIGRTARMGRSGKAITFVSEWDLEIFDKIKDHIGQELLLGRKLMIYGGGEV